MSGYCVQGDHGECPNFEDSCSCPCHLYDVALNVTDEVCGEGTYARLNSGNADPGVQAAIRRKETQ